MEEIKDYRELLADAFRDEDAWIKRVNNVLEKSHLYDSIYVVDYRSAQENAQSLSKFLAAKPIIQEYDAWKKQKMKDPANWPQLRSPGRDEDAPGLRERGETPYWFERLCDDDAHEAKLFGPKRFQDWDKDLV